MLSFPDLVAQSQLAHQEQDHAAAGFWQKRSQRQKHEHQLRELDRQLLKMMFSKRYLSTVPQVHYNQGQGASEVRTSLNGWGNITINMKDQELDRWKGQVDPSMMRWFILLHEASHCVFDTRVHKFQSTKTTPEQTHALNRWTFNTVFRGFLYRCLNEAFADTYAVMMLMQQDRQSARTQKIAMDVQAIRHHLAQEENDVFETKSQGKTSAKPSVYLACEAALVRACSTQDQWLDMMPEQLLDHAMTCASEGLMDAMATYAHTAAGKYMIQSLQGFPEYRHFISMYAIEMVDHTQDTFLYGMSKHMGGHPGWPFVEQLCQMIAPSLNTSILRQAQEGKYARGQMDASFCDYLQHAQLLSNDASQLLEHRNTPELSGMMEAWQSDLSHQVSVIEQLSHNASKLNKSEQKRAWSPLKTLTAGMK